MCSHICTYENSDTYTHTHMHKCTLKHRYSHTHMYTCIHTKAGILAHAYIHICTHILGNLYLMTI